MEIVQTFISAFTQTASEYPKNRTPQAIVEILAPFSRITPSTTHISPNQAPSPHRGTGLSLHFQDSQLPPNQLFITASSGDRRQPPFQLFLHAIDTLGFSRAQVQIVSTSTELTITQAMVCQPPHLQIEERLMVVNAGDTPRKFFNAIYTLLSR